MEQGLRSWRECGCVLPHRSARHRGDNRTSSWSVNAIEKYTGISRPRAIRAVGALIEANLLTRMKGGKYPQYQLAPEYTGNDPADLIWLPNSVVDGLDRETPPVDLLWQAQNSDAVRLFGNLYQARELTGRWRDRMAKGQGDNVFQFKREKISEYGPYVLWGFRAKGIEAWPQSTFAQRHPRRSAAPPQETWDGFWTAQRLLSGTPAWPNSLLIS